MKKRLKRRAFLSGVGGAAVALPFLEIMGDGRRAKAENGAPNRFLLAFAGSSLGVGNRKNLGLVVPTDTGMNYEAPLALRGERGFRGWRRSMPKPVWRRWATSITPALTGSRPSRPIS